MKIASNHVLLLRKSALACRRSGGGLEFQCRRAPGGQSPNSAAGMLRCWLRICCMTAAGAFGQPGDVLSPGMSLRQSPQPLLSSLPRFGFFSQSSCMLIWREEQGTSFDLQKSRGIRVKLPIDFPAFQSRKALFPLCLT